MGKILLKHSEDFNCCKKNSQTWCYITNKTYLLKNLLCKYLVCPSMINFSGFNRRARIDQCFYNFYKKQSFSKCRVVNCNYKFTCNSSVYESFNCKQRKKIEFIVSKVCLNLQRLMDNIEIWGIIAKYDYSNRAIHFMKIAF